MANLTTAVAGLVSLGATVANLKGGHVNSYGLDRFFSQKLGAELPCLIVVPDLGWQDGFSTSSMMGNSPKLDFVLDHLLLYKPVGATSDLTTVMPGLIQLADNYFTALKALPYLTSTAAPATHFATKVPYRFQTTTWGEQKYHSIAFRHKLGINL